MKCPTELNNACEKERIETTLSVTPLLLLLPNDAFKVQTANELDFMMGGRSRPFRIIVKLYLVSIQI